jgi:hypothetical protein
MQGALIMCYCKKRGVTFLFYKKSDASYKNIDIKKVSTYGSKIDTFFPNINSNITSYLNEIN